MESRFVYGLHVSTPPRRCCSDDWGSFCEWLLRDAVDRLLQDQIDRASDCYLLYSVVKKLMEKRIDAVE